LDEDVCTQCEVSSQQPYDVDAVLKELSWYFIPLEDVRGEVEEAKDAEEFKTLCNLCRAYWISDSYYHEKLQVPLSHEDPNSLDEWDDLAKYALGIHQRSKRLTQAMALLKVTDIICHSVRQGAEAIEKSMRMSDNVRMYKILFTLFLLDRQGRNTSKMERDLIRDWRKQFSIRELAFIADRSTSTIHDIIGYQQTT
jgi:hypothetical protein